ncbi:hypothetical protein DESC_810152 [Desulfosarcina cetonica]|nr:hypothetical protein DESC_810152 [Desulfosarcina cetonica]
MTNNKGSAKNGAAFIIPSPPFSPSTLHVDLKVRLNIMVWSAPLRLRTTTIPSWWHGRKMDEPLCRSWDCPQQAGMTTERLIWMEGEEEYINGLQGQPETGSALTSLFRHNTGFGLPC